MVVMTTELFDMIKEAWGLPGNVTGIEIRLEPEEAVRVRCDYVPDVSIEHIERLAEEYVMFKRSSRDAVQPS